MFENILSTCFALSWIFVTVTLITKQIIWRVSISVSNKSWIFFVNFILYSSPLRSSTPEISINLLGLLNAKID